MVRMDHLWGLDGEIKNSNRILARKSFGVPTVGPETLFTSVESAYILLLALKTPYGIS
jgi:hypothetical protein